MKWEESTFGKPGRGEVPLRQTRIGVEAADIIEAVGPGVKGPKAGDRVCYARR